VKRNAKDTAWTATGIAGLLALYVLMVLPFVLWPLDPQPDERFYSIAASHMLHVGDFLVPVSETGEVRLKKPPLTYLYVAAGFTVAGETLVGAKLFFLLSAMGIIALAYMLARALGASRPAALFGAAMLVGHRLFFTTSTQYIPDTPLILGTTAALVGFVHVLRDTARPWHFYLAWVGIAWAVLAKGFLAPLMLLLYALARHLPGAPTLSPRMRRHELVAAVLAAALALPWFLLMAAWHPDELFAQFLGDQVTEKVRIGVPSVLAGIGNLSWQLFLLTLPGMMVLALARVAATGAAISPPNRGPAVTFLLLWIALNLVIFAFSSVVFGRYALPAAPAVMALAAAYLSRLPAEAVAAGFRRTITILLPILATLGLAGALLGLVFGATAFGIGGALVLAAVAVPIWWGRRTAPVVAGTVLVALFFPAIELSRVPFAHAALLPTEAQRAAHRIAQLDPGDTVVVVADRARLVDRIGIELGDMRRVAFARGLADIDDPDVVVFRDPELLEPLRQAGYDIEDIPFMDDFDMTAREIRDLVLQADVDAMRAAYGSRLYYASRP
jgi:4-amino-4-deoxy-L-arabinose transferase-like glycosyltransferase